MKLVPNRRHLKILAVVLVLALAGYSWQQFSNHYSKREHRMTELTKNMKTVCFGRYLIDIPAQAEFAIGNTAINAIKIEYVESASNELLFQENIKKRESSLRTAKHNTEGVLLREALDVNGGKHRLLVYRQDQKDSFLTWVETSVHFEKDEWKISFNAADEDVPEVKSLVTRLAAELKPRNLQDIPSTPGACIKNGLITGGNYEAENIIAGIRMQDPEFSLKITSETSSRANPGETLWERIDKADKLSKEIFNTSFKPLRKATARIDGRTGQEYVSLVEEKGKESFNAKAEVYGDGTTKQPSFEAEMDIQRNLKLSNNKKQFSNDEALALWDAILKSIRPRPGAF